MEYNVAPNYKLHKNNDSWFRKFIIEGHCAKFIIEGHGAQTLYQYIQKKAFVKITYCRVFVVGHF